MRFFATTWRSAEYVDEQRLRAAALEHVAELPADVEAVLHGHVHALACLCTVRVAGVAGDEHTRRAGVPLGGQDVVEPVGEAVAHLVHAVPGDIADIEGVGLQDLVRVGDDLLDGGLADGAVVVLGHYAEVDVHAEQVAALARDQQDAAAVVGLDGALGADVREVGGRRGRP
jgi:hypothetical protein